MFAPLQRISTPAKWFRQLVIICTLLLTINTSHAQVVYLDTPDFPTLQDQARATGKNIMLLCCTEWCGPCKTIKNDYFRDTAVGRFINSRYVVGYYDMEKEPGITLAKKYGITGYPTLVYLTPGFDFIYSFAGAPYSTAGMIGLAGNAEKAQKNQFPGISNVINLPFPDFYNHYFEEKKKTKVPVDTVEAYLGKQNNLFSEVNWRVMQAMDYGPRYDSFFIDNYKEYFKLYSTEARQKAFRTINNSLKEIGQTKDRARMQYLVSFMKELKLSENDILQKKIFFYGKSGLDWDLYLQMVDTAVKKYKSNFLVFSSDAVVNPSFPAKASKAFLKLIDSALSKETNKTQLAWLYVNKALLLEKARLTAQAEELYEKAIALYPEDLRKDLVWTIGNSRKELQDGLAK
ncbi:MAG: thioredoxin family protein [Candidatus Pseudobacter hemicellulosilyticus]|uniref:Thioredoxin family protein n=1 Tax=Candidatus Pseudobacter hemicellulosilyticus TaxID=3121375 RepID=A0AAJ5WQU1_9BACT|nr:MAG: thioredoxin family protein [Pseudobacter sp.]